MLKRFMESIFHFNFILEHRLVHDMRVPRGERARLGVDVQRRANALHELPRRGVRVDSERRYEPQQCERSVARRDRVLRVACAPYGDPRPAIGRVEHRARGARVAEHIQPARVVYVRK